MKLHERYNRLLGQIDDLASRLEQDHKAVPTRDERETIAAAFNALNRATKERDETAAALDRAQRALWDALGGGDDKDCREVADRHCEPYVALLRKLGWAP